MNNLKRLTTSNTPVVDLELIKRQAHIWSNDDDAFLDHLIKAAVASIEGPQGIGIALLSSNWLQHHSGCQHGPVWLPLAPVSTVTKVETCLSGTWTDVDPTGYRVTTGIRPAKVEPVTAWPAHDALRVTFTAGFGAAASDVPADLVAAIFMLVTHWFENRAPLDGQGVEMPFAVTSILNRYR